MEIKGANGNKEASFPPPTNEKLKKAATPALAPPTRASAPHSPRILGKKKKSFQEFLFFKFPNLFFLFPRERKIKFFREQKKDCQENFKEKSDSQKSRK